MVSRGSLPACTAAIFGTRRVVSRSGVPFAAPAMLKARSEMAPMVLPAVHAAARWSAATLLAPYGFAGTIGDSSVRGCGASAAYMAAVDASTNRLGRVRFAVASRADTTLKVPPVLTVQYSAGLDADMRGRVTAARWQTASTSATSVCTAAWSRMSATGPAACFGRRDSGT